MTKPIEILELSTGKYAVRVDETLARAFGAKGRKLPHGNVFRGSDGKLDIGGKAPEGFSLEDAKSVAHRIGRYKLGFGDLVFAYTSAPEGAF